MKKVYLLLRNNKQSGPHTLEELLQLGLKPKDLIWIEGKSAGWSYPSEINDLKPHLDAASQSTALQETLQKAEVQASPPIDNQAFMPVEKQSSAFDESSPASKVYVSMPVSINKSTELKKPEVENIILPQADIIEWKAEELRKKIQSYTPESRAAEKKEQAIVTKFQSTIPEREKEYTSWIYNQKINKTKKISEEQKKWGAIAVAALLLLTVGFGISQYHNDDKKEVELVATTVTPDSNNSAPGPLITEPETPTTLPVTEKNIAGNSAAAVSSPEPEKKITNTTATINKPVKEVKKVVSAPAEVHKKITGNKTNVTGSVIIKPDETKQPEIKIVPKKETEPVVVATKKNKSLNEKVDAFFRKFSHKVEEPPVVVNTPPAEDTKSFPGTTERKAIHRDDKPVDVAPPVSTNLAEYVEVTSNKPSANWMLGVHGLKVSLHNTGNETIKTAAVELRYYTEQNEVLEKKTVNFINISPGKTITLPAPDHRLADHADFRLVNAK